MGKQTDDVRHDVKVTAASKKRGQGRRGRSTGAGDFQLSFVHWALLQALTRAVMSEGGAVRIGCTRDGGALALGVYVDQDYGTEYIRPDEDLGDALAEIADEWLKGRAALYYEYVERVEAEFAMTVTQTGEKPPKRT